MADFHYWNKSNGQDGFGHLSVYLKNPSNNRPGWYFANPTLYPVHYTNRNGVRFYKMPVKFGIHHPAAGPEDAAKPTKMGVPGDFLVEQSTGGLQLMSSHEFSLNSTNKTSEILGQKIAESSITIQTGATGVSPGPSPSMGGGSGYSGGY